MARRATKKKRGGTVYSVPPLFFKQLSLDTDNIVIPIDIYLKETELLALLLFNVNHFFPWTTIRIPVSLGERR